MLIGPLDKSESAASPKEQGLAPASAIPSEARLLWPDVMRVYAILAVIVIHSCVPFYYQYRLLTHFNWLVCDFCNAVSRYCIPFFVMISGMFLLAKNETLAVFFAKRAKKVFIPFLFWQIFYFIWEGYQIRHNLNLSELYPAIFVGASSYHLWYLFMLTGLYLATPILRVFVQNASETQIRYFLASWFCFAVLLPIWERFGQVPIKDKVEAVVALGYSGYFVLGYYLRNKQLGALGAKIAIALIPIAVGFSVIATNKLAAKRLSVDEFFMQYLSPNIIIYSVCLYLLIKRIDYSKLYAKIPALQKLIGICSATSFGVYLVHVCVLANVYRACNISIRDPVLIAVPVLVVLTYAISLVVVKLLQAIPGVRAVVPG